MSRQNRAGLFELPENPELEDLFRHALRNLAVSLWCHVPATVKSYDATTQTASVTVDVLQTVRALDKSPSAADPAPTSTLDPVELVDVPVVWPRAGGGYLTFPLQAGDTGELHVQDRDLAQWRQLGKPVKPVSAFVHILGHGVFHPGLHPDTSPIVPPTDTTAAVLEHTLIKIGRSATQGTVRVSDLATFLQTAATTAAGAAIPNDGGAAAFTAFANSMLGLVAAAGSTKVQVE